MYELIRYQRGIMKKVHTPSGFAFLIPDCTVNNLPVFWNENSKRVLKRQQYQIQSYILYT